MRGKETGTARDRTETETETGTVRRSSLPPFPLLHHLRFRCLVIVCNLSLSNVMVIVFARNVVAGLEVFKVLERNRRRKIETRRRGGRRRWRPAGGEVEAEKMEETELGGKRTEAWFGVARWLLLEPEQRAMLRGGVG